MDNSTPQSTLSIKGRTSFAQIPKWVLRSQGKLSGNAVHMYGVIMSYASNDELTAFPGRERLAEDIGKSTDAVSRYIKELETFGALKVERRRNKRTGNFYANRYSLIWNPPCGKTESRRGGESAPITIPTVITTPTDLYTVNSEESTLGLHDDTNVPLRHSNNVMAGMTHQQRTEAIRIIQHIGQLISDGHTMHDDELDEPIGALYTHVENSTASWDHHSELLDQINNGFWTFSPAEATAYNAGKKLNKMLNTVAVTS